MPLPDSAAKLISDETLPRDKPRSAKTGCRSLRQIAPWDTVNLSHARACLGARALGPPAGPRPPPFAGRQAWIFTTDRPSCPTRRGGYFL